MFKRQQNVFPYGKIVTVNECVFKKRSVVEVFCKNLQYWTSWKFNRHLFVDALWQAHWLPAVFCT